MIQRHHAIAAAGELRALNGVTRVLLARRDGVPFYDDLSLASREHAAAATASAGGVMSVICGAAQLGSVEGGAVFGSHGVLVMRPLASEYVLAAVADGSVDVSDLYRRLRKQARILDELAEASAPQ